MVEPLPKELQVARTILSRKHPYVSNILWTVEFKPMPGIGTLGVDKHWRCVFDPVVLKKWSTDEVVGVLFHEINHLLRDHPKRSETIVGLALDAGLENITDAIKHELLKMNIAEDMEINPGILKAGFKLPNGPALPGQIGQPDGLLAEEYYRKFPKQKSSGKIGIGNGRCGSCAGNPSDGEDGTPPAKGNGISSAERELIKLSVAKEIENSSKTRGDIPDHLLRWAEALLHPQVNWVKEFASVVRRSVVEVMGKQDYTYKRPGRKAGCLDKHIITPGTKAFIPNVAIVIDTSGSMGGSDLAKALAECKGILQVLGGGGYGITEIAVDCSVSVKKRVRSTSQVDLKGGGGTDMCVGLREAKGLKPMPHIVVVVTDGYTPWPTENTPFKTIVVLTQAGARAAVPEFFRCIVVN